MSHSADTVESRARARRRRAAITLVVMVIGLFFAFWYAYSYYQADVSSASDSTSSTQGCQAKTYVAPEKITVNVYNSTDRNGLAATTGRTLRSRGFTVHSIANDPRHKTIKGVAEVRFGKKGKKASATVVALVPGAKAVQDKRKNARVDLVLGEKYRDLAPMSALTSCR